MCAPFVQTYQLAAIAKINKNPIKRNDSKLFADTLSVENIIVRTSWPCAVPNPVLNTTAKHPPSGVSPFPPALDCNTFVPQNSGQLEATPPDSPEGESPPPEIVVDADAPAQKIRVLLTLASIQGMAELKISEVFIQLTSFSSPHQR